MTSATSVTGAMGAMGAATWDAARGSAGGASRGPVGGAARVVVADDDDSLRHALGRIFCQAGYECLECPDGRGALELCLAERPDAVVLDVMMPGLDGFEACERMRAAGLDAPVLFLSAKSDIVDKKTGFRLGGDDYLTKPFEEEELLIRVQALLRRSRMGAAKAGGPKDDRLAVGDVVLDPAQFKVTVAGSEVRLTLTEFRILQELASNAGNVVTSDELIRTIWGDEYSGDPVNLPVYIRRLRKKIERDPSDPVYIKTVYRLGYKMGDGRGEPMR